MVRRLLEEPGSAAAQVTVVTMDGEQFACTAIWGSRDGLLSEGTECWVTVGGERPPAIRAWSRPT